MEGGDLMYLGYSFCKVSADRDCASDLTEQKRTLNFSYEEQTNIEFGFIY